VQRRIVLVTGSHHYQVYWVASQRGRELRQFPWAWHLSEQRWIPGEDVFIRPPDAKRRFALWAKEPGNSGWFRNCPFEGTLGKKLKATIVEWVKALEQALPELQEKAAADDRAWVTWHRALRTEIREVTNRVSIQHYDGEVKEAQVAISGWLTPEQLKAIAEIVANNKVEA